MVYTQSIEQITNTINAKIITTLSCFEKTGRASVITIARLTIKPIVHHIKDFLHFSAIIFI